MKKYYENEAVLVLDHSVKPRKPKSKEVSSRFLSSTSTSSLEIGNPSPTQGLSPVRRKPGSSFPETRKNRAQLEDSGFLRGLWPSSTTTTASSSSSINKLDTLADHLGNERLNDLLERKSSGFLDRQRSTREFSSRFESDIKESTKENYRPILGGSMRYTGKASSSSSSSTSLSNPSKLYNSGSDIVPGRFSVDENVFNHQKPSRRISDSFTGVLGSGFECSDSFSGSDFGSRVRRSGVEVSSKYMNDIGTRPRRGNLDSNISNPLSLDNSPRLGKLSIKSTIKRVNSLTSGYGNGKSQWALSPGRSGSPSLSVESKGKLMSFSSLKPPNSSSRTKGVEKLFNFGIDFFKSKKSSSSSSSSNSTNSTSSNLLPGNGTTEASHQLRLLHNRFIQWRYANARADSVNSNIANHVEVHIMRSKFIK